MNENIEQMEAAEIGATPRIVITGHGFFVFPPKGKELNLNWAQLKCVESLGQALADQQNNKGKL